MRYLIIGGVAGGATAATRLRRRDENAEIIILEKGEHVSYANCGLPYYIGGVIKDRDNLLLQTPAKFKESHNIDVRVRHEALSIDPAKKTVKVKDDTGNIVDMTYDKLVLSPGAIPFVPPMEGADLPGIFTLRDVHDTDCIKNYIQKNDVKRAIVIGAGFIGLEMVENFHGLGIDTSIVEKMNQVMGPLDYSMAAIIHELLLRKGVKLYLEKDITKITKEKSGLAVHFSDGTQIFADIIMMSVGVRPNTKLAMDASLKIGEMRGIWVDEFLQTSDPDIYAVGDAIEYPHPTTGKPWLNYLAGPANRQARIAADNIVDGNKHKYEGSIGTAVAQIFELVTASTGLPAKRLQQFDIPYKSSWTHSLNHAGYYPGATFIALKIVFDPETGKLYGVQAMGQNGVDKRIDEIAGIIKRGGTIYDLTETEQAYAPPFSSAKDPIAIAGYVAENIITGKVNTINWRDMEKILADKDPNIFLLDVRVPVEASLGMLPGAVNIPIESLRQHLDEIPKDKKIVVYCTSGHRSYKAVCILKGHGYTNLVNLSGGMKTYKSSTLDVKEENARIAKDRKEAVAKPADAYQKPIYQAQAAKDIKFVKTIDACGLSCPGPILKLKQAVDDIANGEAIEIISSDIGFMRDAEAWCKSSGNTLLSIGEKDGKISALIQKGSQIPAVEHSGSAKGKTFIMFSDSLDKVLATFILANGAAATGQKVTIFFTFWGLNVIKKANVKAKKDSWGKMFGMMMPKTTKKLSLSQMNMLGMGSKMMRMVMKKRGINTLEELRQSAIDQNVEFIACQMSMDVMGVKKEELLDNVNIGGVATYMERADQANVNLFI